MQDSSPLLSTVDTHLSKLGLKVGMSICQYARVPLQIILASGLTPPEASCGLCAALLSGSPYGIPPLTGTLYEYMTSTSQH